MLIQALWTEWRNNCWWMSNCYLRVLSLKIKSFFQNKREVNLFKRYTDLAAFFISLMLVLSSQIVIHDNLMP